MVDLPSYTPETALTTLPEQRVSAGDIERSADAIPAGLEKLGQGMGQLAVPLAQQAGDDAAAKVSITRDANGAVNVATPQNSFIMGEAGDAYAEATTQGTLAKLHTQIDTDLVNMAQANKANPQQFRVAAQSYLSNLRNSGNPIDQHAADYGAQVAAQHYGGLVDDLGRIDVQSSYQAQKDRLTYIENGMDGLAAQGGTDLPQFKAWVAERQSILTGFVANPLYGYNAQMRSVDEDQFATRMQSSAAVAAARQVYQQTGNLTQAQSVLHDKIDSLPIDYGAKLRLEGEVTEHMRGWDAVRQQENDSLKNTASTVVTQGMAEGRLDPGTTSSLIGQLNSRRLYAAAANVEGAALFLQYKGAFNPDGTSDGWAKAYAGFQASINKQTQGVLNAGPMPLTPQQRDLIVRTIAGEAGGESDLGQAGVASVIRNRVLSGNYGSSVESVINAPDQFSVWNPGDPAGNIARNIQPGSPQYERIARTVDGVFGGKIADPTHGADHYYNPSEANPSWGNTLAQQNDITIGNHRFVGGSGAPSQAEVAPALKVYVDQATKLYNDHFQAVWGPMKQVLDKGLLPSGQEFSDLKTLAPYVTDQKTLSEVRDTLNVAGQIQAFKKLPASQQQDVAATMGILGQNGGLNNIQRQTAGQMKVVADHTANLAKNDAVSYAFYKLPQAVQKTLPSLDYDVTQPASLAAGLKAGQAWKNAAHASDNSVTSQGVMTDVKRDQLASSMPGMNAQQAKGTLDALSTLQPQELDTELAVPRTKDAIVGLTRSGDYGKMNAAYGFMDHLQQQNPAAFEARFGGDMLKNLRVWQAKSAYEPPDQVAKDMLTADDPSTMKAKDALRQQADADLKNVDATAVARKFGSGFPLLGRTPDMMTQTPATSLEAMRQDYMDAYKDMYAEVGDKTKADAYAVERLSQKYGVSGVNGGKLMAYPPDKTNPDGTGTYYPKIGGSFDWIKGQLDASMMRYGDENINTLEKRQDVLNFVAAPRSLVGDTTTQAEIASHRPPSYQVVVQDPKTGNIRVLNDSATGRALRFRPDPAPALQQQSADFEAQRETDAAGNSPFPPGI